MTKANPNFSTTNRQRKLEKMANRILAKARYFPKRKRMDDEYQPVEADAIGGNSRLRPTWQGRA